MTRSHEPAFAASSTRNPAELTGNDTEGRTLEHFTESLAAVYRQMAIGLKPGAPLAFTYHHNRGEAYHPVAVAILDAGLAVTASLPCPAEMGGSIHISGTRSSIVDTVFVCRALKRSPAAGDPSVAQAVAADLHALRTGGVKPTEGDARCIAFGHMTRLTVQSLRPSWDASASVRSKLAKVANSMRRQGCVDAVIDQVYAVKQGSGRAVQT